ncbi:hypothetical protein AB0D99_15435 [Streptomyces sp. NPDC047971]|uniref:hypothetical protein n=1 Tax=Streptomyces sp. NPDC047971 TaxID=3154499 RepID=UPI0033F2E7E7
MRRLAIPLLTLFALVGCTAQEPEQNAAADPQARPAASRGPEPTVSARDYTFRLPIARFSYTSADYAVIEAAEQVLAKRCMADYSIAYEPPVRPAPTQALDRRYGLSDESTAARYGYRLPPVRESAPDSGIGKDELVVLYGTRGAEKTSGPVEYRGRKILVEGCLGKAAIDFRKDYDYPEGGAVATRISAQSFVDSQKDKSVRAGFAQWSGCMTKKGFSYSSPLDLFTVEKFEKGPVTDEEKATAVADVACKNDTGLPETWLAVESRLQEAMIAKDSAVLQKLRGLHEKKIAAARAIVAKG